MTEKMARVTIITHKSPDLDSCVAIWILKRFIYPQTEFDYLFVDAGEFVSNIPNSIHVDTGGIDYDHHQTNDFVSAATLVYTKNNLHDSVIERIAKFTLRVDHGKIKAKNYHFFHPIHALNGLMGRDSVATLQAMLTILDGVYNQLSLSLEANRKFKTGTKFNSQLGQGIAFNTENPHIREKAYYKDYKIFLFKDEVTGFAGFKAHGNSEINFKELYKEITKIEPSADWFLHSSNQLLLCGSAKAPRKKLTKLDLNQLINIISTHAKK